MTRLLVATLLSWCGSANAQTVVSVPWNSDGYRFDISGLAAQFDSSEACNTDLTGGFETVAFDHSGWGVASAGFGITRPLACDIFPLGVQTRWPGRSVLRARKNAKLPAGASNVTVSLAIDNDFQLFVNGACISGYVVNSGCAYRGEFVYTIPDELLVPGFNVIAVWANTYDSDAFFDMQVTCDDCSGSDADEDWVLDDDDNCPTTPNTDQLDTDADALGDACDTCVSDPDNDADDDELCAESDNCPWDANSDQQDLDWDGDGDACDDDLDGDGASNDTDTCPYDVDPDQRDTDGDGAGDACDADVDGDSVRDDVDSCVPSPLGEVVDAGGCAIGEYCPTTNTWKNHGAYVSCVSRQAEAFSDLGLLTQQQHDDYVSVAGASEVGKPATSASGKP